MGDLAAFIGEMLPFGDTVALGEKVAFCGIVAFVIY